MENNITHYTGMADAELESQLSAQHENIKKLADEKGHEAGRKKQPELRGGSLSVFVGLIVSQYAEMKSRIMGRLQPDKTKAEMKALQKTTDEKIKVLVKDKEKANTDLFNYETELYRKGISLDELAKAKSKAPDKKAIGLYLIGIAETFFTATGIQAGIGHSFITALIISTGISIALYFAASYIGKHIKEFGFTANSKSSMVTIGASLVALGIFISLALWRSQYLKEQEDASISPFFLVLVNVLFFGVVVWFFHRTSKTSEQIKREEDLLQQKKQWEEFTAKVQEIDNKIKDMKEDLAKRLTLLSHKPDYAKYLCERIDHMCEESIKIFISSNIASRSDGVPDCFVAYSNKKQNV